MIKNSLIIFLAAVSLSSCSIIDKIPDKFDNQEYAYLVELNVTSSHSSTCEIEEIVYMDHLAAVLEKYSEHTLNKNTTEIYAEIRSLTRELVSRASPSEAYCKLKRNNISKVTNETLSVFGNRRK
jgi:hypothetical protein